MGQMTDMRIAEWQKKAGIEPATGERREALDDLSRQAYELIRVIELERSGIRDGDGCWHGSDALDGTVRNFAAQWERMENHPVVPEDNPETLRTAVANGLARLRGDWGLDRAPNPALDHPLHHMTALAARDALETGDLVKLGSAEAALKLLDMDTSPYGDSDDCLF